MTNNNNIQAKIVADSLNIQGDRITTMMVTFPRYILAELNTHRMFSRNSASSRAIPFKKMVESVKNNPFIPIAWQKDHTGMQGTEYITDEGTIATIQDVWIEASENAIEAAEHLNQELEVTKQFANRLLEPYMWHTVLITATEWENFFQLRCPQYFFIYENEPSRFFRSQKDFMSYYESVHKVPMCKEASQTDYDGVIGWLELNKGQADIHMMSLAEAMWDAMNESTPTTLQPGEWHIPFGDNILIPGLEGLEANTIKTVKISTARCARVSYTVVGEEEKVVDYEKDVELHDRLLKSGHFSPFEHCAKAMNDEEFMEFVNGRAIDWIHSPTAPIFDLKHAHGWCRNYKGFIQYRSMLDQ